MDVGFEYGRLRRQSAELMTAVARFQAEARRCLATERPEGKPPDARVAAVDKAVARVARAADVLHNTVRHAEHAARGFRGKPD